MQRRFPRLVWLAAPLAYILYFHGLSAAGLLGPDEPRYASIGREMARSGDWITPRLWGQPWFEKPALLYWMTGLGFRAGLGTELAPRLPVAALAVAFLAFFWWVARREFGERAAWMAVFILGTCAEWLGYSQVAVPDVPLTATFSAAMLLLIPWIARGETRLLPAAGAMFGAATLAKGLVPLGLAVPAFGCAWLARRWNPRLRDGGPRLLPRLAGRFGVPFAVVALPWYLLCYLRNGSQFFIQFIWKHHFLRLASNELAHLQPWWYYAPIFAAAFLPWTPALALIARLKMGRDIRLWFLAAWVAFGLAVFSVSVNKLPGYVLPLLPPAALLAALALDEAAHAEWWLAACAIPLAAFLAAADVLPAALGTGGLSHAPRPAFHWIWLAPLPLAALVWILARRGRRVMAIAAIAAGAACAILYVKQTALPAVDSMASSRAIWRQVGPKASETCVEGLQRDWLYGLNYYSVVPLPECKDVPRPLHLRQKAGETPFIVAAAYSRGPSDGIISRSRN